LPTIDIAAFNSYSRASANEHLSGQDFNQNFNNVMTRNHDRQVALQVTVPLFSGGLTQSRVRQAQFFWIAAKEQVVQTSRATERQARDAYLGVISGIARVQALRQALESSRTALEATEAGYEVGTRTSLDVLNARRTLVQAQTEYSGSRYDYIVSVLQLHLAAGNLNFAQLAAINPWLVAAAPTSPAVPTPQNLSPSVSPDTTHTPQ
jgi:outer membrane protein